MWRRIFEEPIDYLLHQKSCEHSLVHIQKPYNSSLAVLVSISSGGMLLRSWDIASGYLQWEVAVQSSHDPSLLGQGVQVDGGWGSGEVKVTLAESKFTIHV